jgi:hypothetical protein
VDDEIPLTTVRNVVIVTDAAGKVRDLTFEYTREDGTHVLVAMPLTLKAHDRGTRLLNRFRVHGIEVRVLRA